jgi:hypothetical protein
MKAGQFYSCTDWEESLNLKKDNMGSNPQPPAHEVCVKKFVPSYSLNNITVGPEHVDSRAIEF